MRYTKSDLDAAFQRYIRSIEGLPRAEGKLALFEGSKTYGNPFKVVIIDPVGGGHLHAPGTYDGLLGLTKREAVEALQHLARAFEYMSTAEELYGHNSL